MQIKVTRLTELARLPTLATEGAACFDIYTTIQYSQLISNDEPTVFNTGLVFEIPEKHVMLVFSRSGHGFKHNVRLANAVGVIDSDFRGELKIKLTTDNLSYTVEPGERIAQVMILPVPAITFTEADVLSDTVRGIGGFGSTN